MSEQGYVFGCIFGGGPIGSRKWMDFYRHNLETVHTLPENGDWEKSIYVSRNMFTVPMPDVDIGFYRYQMIHFGASFNHFDVYWETWLNQFEALLRQLFWFEVRLYMKAEGFAGSNTEYYWKADIAPMHEESPQPIKEWEFVGGPRSFPDLF